MFTTWFIVAGALLIGMALAGSALRRAPLTASMFYLGAGAALGPWGAGLLHIDAVEDASVLERLTEIAVIISLFTAGLKLRLPGSDQRWRAPILFGGAYYRGHRRVRDGGSRSIGWGGRVARCAARANGSRPSV
jgi:Kef-type K+ transport system membrane component KefB